jgi:glycosyltransferase involved in cell wall biosynthesis
MRITIVQGGFLPVPPLEGGAVEKVWFSLGAEFARRGSQVKHISRLYRDLPAREIINGVEHLRIRGFDAPRSRLRLWVREFFYARRVVRILPPADILVTNSVWLPALVRDKSRGAIYVHIGRFPKRQTRLYHRAARLQTVSNVVAQAIKDQDPRSVAKVRSIPYPLPYRIEQIDVKQTWSAREQVILYVGRIHPEKGIHILVEAFQELVKRGFTGWRLAIVGPWKPSQGGGGQDYYDSLRRKTLEAADRIDWIGPVFNQEELVKHYRRAKLFVYPSLAEKGESFGLAPLEAMASGCPALVSGLGCFRDFIRDGQTGFVFDHRESLIAPTLSRRMNEIVANEAALLAVAERAYRAAQAYDLPRVADLYVKDFESIAAVPAESRSCGNKV